MRKTIIIATFLALAGLCVWDYQTQHKHLVHQASASGQAYTIYQHLETGSDSPAPLTNETRIIAQRSDGSRVVSKHDLHLLYVDREIVLIPQQLQIKVSDEVKAMSTVKVEASTYMKSWGTPRDPASGCTTPLPGGKTETVNTILGTETISGVETNKVQVQPNFVVWMAPALNCQEMKHLISFTDGKPSTTTLYTDQVTWGEPDPALFAVPSDYSEVAPSEAQRLRLVHIGAPQDVINRRVQHWQQLDPRYLANRP